MCDQTATEIAKNLPLLVKIAKYQILKLESTGESHAKVVETLWDIR